MILQSQAQNVSIIEEQFHDKTIPPFELYIKDAFN